MGFNSVKCQKSFSHSSEANIHCLLSQKVITYKLSGSYITLHEWDIIIHTFNDLSITAVIKIHFSTSFKI